MGDAGRRRRLSLVGGALSAEGRALLATVSAPDSRAALEARLGPETSWATLLHLAGSELVSAPVLQGLADAAARAGAPMEARQSFLRLAQVVDFRQARVAKLLEEVLDLLAEHGIEAMVLKGAALAATAYPAFRDRPMRDIDLLVEEEEALEARDRLLEAGWSWDRARMPDAMYRDHYHLPPLDEPAGTGLGLELHTGIFVRDHPFRLTGGVLRKTTVEVAWRGRRLLVPDPAFHLAYVCTHYAWPHGLRSGTWRALRDIQALSTLPGHDWSRLVEIGRDARCASCCFWALRLARDLGGVAVPEGVLEDLSEGLPRPLVPFLERALAAGVLADGPSCPTPGAQHALWTAAIRPGRQGHGSARPWMYNQRFRSLTPEPEPAPTHRRVGRRLGRWVRYLARLAGWRSWGRASLTAAPPSR